MKKSLRFQSVLVILFHIFLLFLLLWAATVPLEQIQQYAAENIGEIGDWVAFKGGLVQVGSRIWSAIVFAAVIGFVIPWMIYRRVQIPIFSIRNTIRQFCRGETDEKWLIQVFCRILVDIGAYRMAWIGYTEYDVHRTVTPAALAGYQNGNRIQPS